MSVRRVSLLSLAVALTALSGRMKLSPSGMSSAMIALDYYLSDKIEIVLVGDGEVRDAMLRELYSSYLPNRIIAIGTSSNGSGSMPLFEGRQAENGEVKAYVCRNSVCNLPVSSVAELREHLQGL